MNEFVLSSFGNSFPISEIGEPPANPSWNLSRLKVNPSFSGLEIGPVLQRGDIQTWILRRILTPLETVSPEAGVHPSSSNSALVAGCFLNRERGVIQATFSIRKLVWRLDVGEDSVRIRLTGYFIGLVFSNDRDTGQLLRPTSRETTHSDKRGNLDRATRGDNSGPQ